MTGQCFFSTTTTTKSGSAHEGLISVLSGKDNSNIQTHSRPSSISSGCALGALVNELRTESEKWFGDEQQSELCHLQSFFYETLIPFHPDILGVICS